MNNMEQSDESLSAVFDRALDLHKTVEDSSEDTNSPAFQEKVKKGILMLEDATRMVSILDIFSRNEHYSELPTEHLKYFLLPVLLGDLNNRLTESDRAEVVQTCQIYYIDFLQRCRDYGFTEIKVPQLKLATDESAKENKLASVPPGRPDLAKMTAEREAKMARFRRSKELESDIKRLRELTTTGGATRDEDLLRDLHIKMVEKCVITALDELAALHMEVDVLQHMTAIRQGKVAAVEVKQSRPLQPIIITKDKLQKEVYGLGYPSLPVMSVDEFYDQRVKEGWFPPGGGQTNALQDKAKNAELAALHKEEEERQLEEKEEQDDPEELARKRAWDDWKDDHRRGEGNRKNMG